MASDQQNNLVKEQDDLSGVDWFHRLVDTMHRLRQPDGCPWDREQTHETLKEYLAEEAAELFDAIDEEDDNGMKEELGDVMLQVVFHAQIADEEGRFAVNDVCRECCEKLWRRHPHVFGESQVQNSQEVLKQWDEIKKGEKEQAPESAVSNVPRHLPALHRAHKMQKKAAKTGFDWPSTEGVIAKIEEELGELKEAVDEENKDAVSEEIGDLLFAVVNLSRYKEQLAEDLLHQAVQKFESRFRKMEKYFADRDVSLEDCSIEELESVWQQMKETC